jgi:tRNA(adenine34) deaminase
MGRCYRMAVGQAKVRPMAVQPDPLLEGLMRVALDEAALAARKGEVPVGAVIATQEGEIIARAHNVRESAKDPLGHAEMLVIRAAAQTLGRWRLSGCTLVVTLEPCPMCAGAVVNSRLDRLVFGADDPKAGAAGSLVNLLQEPRLNHRAEIVSGVLAFESATLLREFFLSRRG